MDILEKYSQADVKEIEGLVKAQLEIDGISKILDYIEMTKYTMAFWEKYQMDRETEKSSYSKILTEEEKKLIKERNIDEKFYRDMKILSQTITTKKLSEEEENALKEEAESLKKYWDIVGNNDSIQNLIATSIKELKYYEDDIDSRIENIKCVLSVLNILNLDEENNRDDEQFDKWSKPYEAILDKLKELSFEDFELVYRNADNTYDMLFNKNAKETVMDIINNMDVAQFSYFMVSLDDLFNEFDEDLKNICIDRIKREDSALLNSTYEFIYEPNGNEEIKSLNVLDKIRSLHIKKYDGVTNLKNYLKLNFNERKKYEKELPQSENFKEYIKVLSELAPKEFVRYMLYHRENFIPYSSKEYNRLTDAIPEEENVIEKKLQELSDLDIKVLLKVFNASKEKKNDNINSWDNNVNNLKNCQIPEVVENLRRSYSVYTYLVLKEALKRRLITEELEPTYSQEEKDIQENFSTYEDINETLLFSGYPSEVNFYFEEDEEGYGEEDEEEEYEIEDRKQQLLQEFEEELEDKVESAEDKIRKEVRILERMHDFSCLNDVDFCKYVNYYNNKISEDKLGELQIPLIYYMKRRILGLPKKYVYFLEHKERGCLDDAIKLKSDELEIVKLTIKEDEREI